MSVFSHRRSVHTEREPLPDVPAVYFVSPDEKTMSKICQVNFSKKSVRRPSYLVKFVSFDIFPFSVLICFIF